MNKDLYTFLLKSQMEYATGCTEPAAIALCCAYAAELLDGEPESVCIHASGNIIKNAMSAGLPGTERTGIMVAGAIGAIAKGSSARLQILDHATAADISKAHALLDQGKVKAYKKETDEKLYIECILTGQDRETRTIIAGSHTELVYAAKDGKVIIDRQKADKEDQYIFTKKTEGFDLAGIFAFINTIDGKTDLKIVEDAISINMDMAAIGLCEDHKLAVGKNQAEAFGNNLYEKICSGTAAAIDARMAGHDHPVVTNSGSGNQGITCTVPVVIYGREKKIDEQRILKAVTLSHLVCIYIHCSFGLLSALCGAVIASCGAACGIVYLMGGGTEQMDAVIRNILGTVSGMLCDGAKPDCALKVVTCIHTACLCAHMAMKGIAVGANEGIVAENAEKTIDNFVAISDKASATIDDIVLKIMLDKKCIKDQRYNLERRNDEQTREIQF